MGELLETLTLLSSIKDLVLRLDPTLSFIQGYIFLFTFPSDNTYNLIIQIQREEEDSCQVTSRSRCHGGKKIRQRKRDKTEGAKERGSILSHTHSMEVV